jgi:hypothetical protein
MITIMDDGTIIDSFAMGDHPYFFTDAIVMPQELYNSFTAQQIEEMKKSRYDRWYQGLTNPLPAPPDLVEEDFVKEA